MSRVQPIIAFLVPGSGAKGAIPFRIGRVHGIADDVTRRSVEGDVMSARMGEPRPEVGTLRQQERGVEQARAIRFRLKRRWLVPQRQQDLASRSQMQIGTIAADRGEADHPLVEGGGGV